MPKAQRLEVPSSARSVPELTHDWPFASMADAVIVAEGSGRIAFWNPAATELLGLSGQEVPNGLVGDWMPGLPETGQWIAAGAGQVTRGVVEVSARRKDGVELTVELTLSRIQSRADGGEYVLILLREKVEHQEATSHHRLEVLAEASRLLDASLDYELTLQEVARVAVRTMSDWCIVHLLEQDGTIRWLAMAHGDPAKEAVARELQDRYPAAGGVTRVLRTGVSEIYSAEGSETQRAARAHDAQHLRMLRELDSRAVMIVPLLARGRMLGALSLISTRPGRIYDAGDLAIAEELARRCGQAVDNARLHQEAQKAVKARDRFVSIASHELRTPIARVKGYAEMLLAAHSDGDLTDEMLTRSLNRIENASDRLTDLVRDLLDVSKINAGNLPLRLRSLEVTDLVRDVVARYQEQMNGRGHLRLDVLGTCRPITGDPDRIEQVLTNLLDNALKYSPDGAALRVRVQAKAGGVLLEFQDHGIGLPPGADERIFEPFSRAPNAEERQITGMGLGLYICRNIVEQHHGRIWAYSAGEGRGTLLSIWLPEQAARDNSAEAATAAA